MFNLKAFLVSQKTKNKDSKRILRNKKKCLKRVVEELSNDVESFSSTESSDESTFVDYNNIADCNVVENRLKEHENCININRTINIEQFTQIPSTVPLEVVPYEMPESQGLQDKCIRESLAAWAVSCKVPHKTLRLLLEILKRCENVDVPLDPRTLLKTPRNNKIVVLSFGKYQHYGIERGLQKILCNGNYSQIASSVLTISINIDDVPINRIQSVTVITGCLDGSQEVFLIGAFVPDRSESKRLRMLKRKTDQDEFLIFVVDELISLFYEGFENLNKHYVVMLDFLCADAPAKAKALKLKGHTGFSSCSKCHVKGENDNRRTYFTNLKAKRRIDEEESLKSKAVWKNIPEYRIVTDTVLDYMHLVILGVTKKLLIFWTEGKKHQALGTGVTSSISQQLAKLKKYTPIDFVRTLENLDFVSQWKATQFRQFLLYQGILVLKKNVPKNIYEMFLHLSLAIRILCSTEKDLYSTANRFLKKFISMFINIYGKKFCNHNIHGLSHLYIDVLNHGPLDKFSTFRFENYMQKIKHDVRKPDNILSQLSNRMAERENVFSKNRTKDEYNRIKTIGFAPLGCQSPQYKRFEFNGFKIDTEKLGDNCLGTKSKEIIKIESIATNKFGKTVLIGKKFLKKQKFIKHPMNSGDLGIFEVSDYSPLQLFELDDIELKYFIMPSKHQRYLVIPIIHSEINEY